MHLNRKLDIGPRERVLDIGPGGFPHDRADVLVERYIGPEGSAQRAGTPVVTMGKPLIVADATALPFSNKSFDFIICSHVLEHAERPDAFLRELGRVGKRGYIECPSELYELLWDCVEHVWFVYSNAERLVLRPKTPGAYRVRYFGNLFPSMLERLPEWGEFIETYADLWFVGYEWTDCPRWTIVEEESRVVDYTDNAWVTATLQQAKRNARRRVGHV